MPRFRRYDARKIDSFAGCTRVRDEGKSITTRVAPTVVLLDARRELMRRDGGLAPALRTVSGVAGFFARLAMRGFGEDFELAFAFEPQLVAGVFFDVGLRNLAEGDAHRRGLLRQRVLHRAEVEGVVAVALIDLVQHRTHLAAAPALRDQLRRAGANPP